MCTEEQHREHMLALKRLEEIARGRDPIDMTVMISSSQAYVMDYQDRKHVFARSTSALTISAEDYGYDQIPQYEWINLAYRTGTKVYASGQTSAVPLFVRCTDETVP